MSSPNNDRVSANEIQGMQARRQLPAPASHKAERDRVLYVPDVLELIRNAKSAWWVRNHFAPEHRFKVGRSPAWWERDAIAWLEARRPQ